MQWIHSSDLHPPHRRPRRSCLGAGWRVVRPLPQVGRIRMGTHRLGTRPTPRDGYRPAERCSAARTALGLSPPCSSGSLGLEMAALETAALAGCLNDGRVRRSLTFDDCPLHVLL